MLLRGPSRLRSAPAGIVRAQPVRRAQRHSVNAVGPSPLSDPAPGRASVAAKPWTPQPAESTAPAPLIPQGRKILVAIDRTDDCLQGLHWVVNNCLRPGDQIELLSVVTNDRAMPISVGMTSPNGRAMTVSFDDDFGYQRTKDYGNRLASEAQADIDQRFKPVAEQVGVEVTTTVATVEGHASAAIIAEAIVDAANASGTDLLVVSSHGGGLKCSYGSVARYCVTHFKRAVMLLPPNMASHVDQDAMSLSVGINQVAELQDAMCWAIDHLFQSGDKVNVLRSNEAKVSGDNTSQATIMSGLREQLKRHHIKDLTYTLIRPSGAAELSPEQFNEASAHELLLKAQAKNSRALVMVNYASQGLMQEMMFGTLSMMASREATMPLALVPQGYAVE